VATYTAQVRLFLQWWWETRPTRTPAKATEQDIFAYRRWLIERGSAPASVALALVALRQFYAALQEARMREDNPTSGVEAPRTVRAEGDIPHLTQEQLQALLKAPEGEGEAALRDKVVLALMGLHGLRTVEVARACVEDLRTTGGQTTLLVRGKGHQRLVVLRPDVAALVARYLAARGEVRADEDGTPLVVATGNRARGKRLTRRGVRKVVDLYLRRLGFKRQRLGAHALRHTAATLAYYHTRDLRAVQAMLGHTSPTITARYAHLVELASPAAAVPVEV
jgi:integrase/recombinase XerD